MVVMELKRIVGPLGLISEGGAIFVIRSAAAHCVELSVDDSCSDDVRTCGDMPVKLLKDGGVGGS